MHAGMDVSNLVIANASAPVKGLGRRPARATTRTGAGVAKPPLMEPREVSRSARGTTLLPECLDDWISDENRVIDAIVNAPDFTELGFDGIERAATNGRRYHPWVLLKLYICGYLNRRHLVPDHKIIADFRKTMEWRYARCARASSICAESWDCFRRRVLPLTEGSDRQQPHALSQSTRPGRPAIADRSACRKNKASQGEAGKTRH